MTWMIKFISYDDFYNHVKETILKYSQNITSYNLEMLNKNLIDPIKLIFDKTVYQLSWEEIIKNEIYRQRDKSNNNNIGYFHQGLFRYIDSCIVPKVGWDVIYESENGLLVEDIRVHKVCVEMKNKHNTMNSASSGKTYIKMQNQLLADDDSACFLVEIIAKKKQNIKWEATVDGTKVSHKLIRRVSVDNFYQIITGEEDAFYQICMVLPNIIIKVINELDKAIVPDDTALSELRSFSEKLGYEDKELSMAMAIYMLGFHSYSGFNKEY